MFKRIISVVVSAVTVVGAIPHIPAKAEEIDRYPYVLFAGSNEDGAITINSNNVCINGNIATNGTVSTSSQNVNINGEITENAQKETKIFFNKIDSRYFASNVDTYFEDFFLEDANINVNIPIEAEGDISLAGNINITSGLKALNDINLSGNVENTQNSAICAQTGDIIINTDNVNLNGLVYAPNGCVNITAKNLNINSVIIIADKISINCPNINANYNTQLAEFIGNDPEIDVDLELVAFGDYTKNENSLNIYWNTTVPKGSFDIMISEDNENYELIGTVTDENTFAYSFSEIFEKKYIKVIETTYYGETYESVPFIILRNDDSYDVNFLDSDDDMLPDIYELKIGTDLNNKDTDNDGLTDFQEYIYTQTDPLIYDSVIEGIPDSDIDTDEDGLSNIDEISRGTYPRTADTDEDGLSDYDEINVYNTDPLNPDSDGEGLNDGSDVKLGLDPNNDATMGIPDEEYVVPQSINADNKIISSINTSDSPYELSVEINTNRDAEKELTIIKSGYSKVIENDAMLGSSVDISITDTCNPEKIVVKYTIKEPYLANTDGSFAELHEFQGIRRLNIFKFNTETNMLLPIDTQFDENNNMLYAEVNELGTYCIMDMEIWLKNLGIEYKSYKDEPSYSLLNARNVKFMSAEPPTPEKKSFNGSQYAVYDMTGMTWEEANAYCNELGGHLVTITTYDEQRFINNNLLKNCKNNLYWIGARAVNDSWQWVTGERFSYTNWKIDEPTDTPDENYIHMYGKSPETYISIGQWNNTYNYCDASANHFYSTLNCGFICEWDKRVSYDIILPTNWKTIYLDGEISPDNGIDTDKDSLTDWEEVDTTRLVWNEDGSFDIPVFDLSEIVNHVKRFDADEYKYLFEECMSNKKRRYLPILSDPSSKDSDGDGLLDGKSQTYDGKPLAPKDEYPMIYNGPYNLWNTHIEEISKKHKTAFDYSNDYYKFPSFEYDIKWTDTFIPLPYMNTNLGEIGRSYITKIASYICDFRYDNEQIALHSDTTQWQEIGGYNDFYDWIFDLATSMDKLKLVFDSNGKNYVIWAWKGNYMFLGAGSEVGFYTQNGILEAFEDYTGFEQWMVADELPMTLSLYHVNGDETINDSYYHWLPDENQWWITGFVPNIHDHSVKASELIQIASVDFSFNPQLLKDLKSEYKNKRESQSLIFDLEDNILWLVW